MMTHFGKRLPPHLRSRSLGVERVARKQDHRRALRPRMLRKPAYRRVPRLAQFGG